MDDRRFTDREMLFLAYGAIRAYDHHNQKEVLKMIEIHLYPPPTPVFLEKDLKETKP